jgi:cytochrome P450
VYCGILAVYNVWYHPLSRYPGPRLAAATSLYYVRQQLRGTCPVDTAKLHEQYGPVVRIAPNELSYVNANVWREIYGHRKPGQPELTKDKKYHKSMGAEPTLLNADREYHGYLRKLLAHGFSDSALRQQESIVQEYIDKMFDQLHKKSERGRVALDINNWYIVRDVLTKLLS